MYHAYVGVRVMDVKRLGYRCARSLGTLFVPGGVILFLELIQVYSDLVPQGDELLVAFLLQRTQLLVTQTNGLIYRRKIIQDQELLQIRHQLHQRLASPHLFVDTQTVDL